MSIYYQDEQAVLHPSVDDLTAGHIGEHLVCANILSQGHVAYFTAQYCAYDIMIDTRCGRHVRTQVKTTRTFRTIPDYVNSVPAYMWHVRRRGRAGRRNYERDEFDCLALVALDCGQIAYMPPESTQKTVHIRPDHVAGGKHFGDFTFDSYLKDVEALEHQGAFDFSTLEAT